MATKDAKRRMSAGTDLAVLKEQSVSTFTKAAMTIYGSEVNEDRAIPSFQDGYKPVQRRLVWAGSQVAKTKVKSAVPVSMAMGDYHPHGDVSLYQALVNMVNSNVPSVTGLGGWGSLIDPASAMRYTNCMMSKYGMEFLKREYLAVVPRVPNYDSTKEEPLYLPALLPNILLNPTSGIGVGMATNIPAYTPESLLTMCLRVLSREELTPRDWAKGLEFYNPWGAKLVKTKANFAALVEFYKGATGTIEFYAPVVLDSVKKQIRMEYFTPGIKIQSSEKKRNEKSAKDSDTGLGVIDRIRKIPQVEQVYTDGGLTFVVQIKKTVNTNECEQVHARVQRMMTAKQPFNLYVTERSPAPEGSYNVKFHHVSVPSLVTMWLKFRVKLEVESLKWRIVEQKKSIDYTKLMILACASLEKIFALLKKRLSKEDLNKGIQADLGIDKDQASQVMELKIHQLSKLDHEQQMEKLKEQKAYLAQLEADLKKPVSVVAKYLDAAKTRFVEFKETNPQQVQWQLKGSL